MNSSRIMAASGLEVAASRADNRRMRTLRWSSLAILLLAVGAPGASEITVYRCVDAKGVVSLQDEPCPAGQTGSQRSMTRPQDPPARASAPPPAPADDEPPEAAPALPPPPAGPLFAPPPLFQCTDYDGDVRYSEDYDPNRRCVPLSVLGYDVRGSAQGAATCRWVSESCLQLDDASACRQFKARLEVARSNALHAFSDTAAFRKSEVTRLERIIRDSCP
ncbi:DUF4124 domain-containing protein [Arenimonas sp. MALMAid1274]|uniref:DUF4124 domain-containing protein n=1 Tax=Arenimonas sp. MALMAid1274 TaxID=3411630 RepID=UPI003B9E3DDA